MMMLVLGTCLTKHVSRRSRVLNMKRYNSNMVNRRNSTSTEKNVRTNMLQREGSSRNLLVEGRMKTFAWSKASHNGIQIHIPKEVDVDIHGFYRDLRDCIHVWRRDGRNAVWLTLDVNQIELSKPAVKVGFEFHNAKGSKTDLVMWLPEHIPNKVPHFGFHQCGVGGLVFNSRNEILLVKERRRKVDRWKMPGGLVDPGETLGQAAVREVWEETGVDAKFESVLGFWQRTLDDHQSDMYFVCRLTAVQDRISVDPIEISEGRWVSLKEYFKTDNQHPMIMSVLQTCFDITSAQQLDPLLKGGQPLEPTVQMSPHQLPVAPNMDPFETYFPLLKPTTL